jgi:predicted metal-dependent peptidase
MVNAQPPKVTVVIDTSGSMMIGNRLNQALVEISGLVRAVSGGARPLQVIACDAEASTPRAVRSIDHIELTGGGGTDMRIGIQAAASMKPRPDIIITITDGETPWPTEANVHAPKAIYVAVVLDENDDGVPSFMKKIVIPARPSSQK